MKVGNNNKIIFFFQSNSPQLYSQQSHIILARKKHFNFFIPVSSAEPMRQKREWVWVLITIIEKIIHPGLTVHLFTLVMRHYRNHKAALVDNWYNVKGANLPGQILCLLVLLQSETVPLRLKWQGEGADVLLTDVGLSTQLFACVPECSRIMETHSWTLS